LISGTPAIAADQDYMFTIRVTDSSTPIQSQTYSYRIHGTVNAPPATPISPPGQGCFGESPAKPAISSTLADGVTDVSGTAAQPTVSGCTAQVELWLLTDQSADRVHRTDTNGNQRLTRLAVSPNVSNGQFDIKLSDPLYQGQRVYLNEVYSTGAGSVDSPLLSDDIYLVSQFGNWGRVKAYFTSGFLLSQAQGNFSQSSLFLSFALDKTWIMPGWYNKHNFRPGINSFFETRLTSIPVTACSPTNSSGSTGAGSSNQSSNCSSSSQSATTPLDTFLSNQKSARLGLGVYFPITATSWTYRGAPQTLFLAPLAKIGFDTPVGSISQTQPANTSASTTTTQGMVAAVNPTNFYSYYGYGARLGHYAMTGSADEAPELISYLDVIVGRFSNLETFVQEGNSGPENLRRRLYRISLEGILKIPNTPLIIGFSANVGQEAVGLGNAHITQRAGDDLRFLFGARFDVAKLVSKIGKVAP
jgi:hypothetical protein